MDHYDDIDYDQFLYPHRNPDFQPDLHWTFLPASEIAKQTRLSTRSSSSRRTPTIRPPKTNSGPPSIRPSSIASPRIPSSATPWWPRSAKSSPTTEAGKIPSPTIAESKNNPGDLVQTNHFRLSGSLRFPPPLSRPIKIADASPERESIHPPENAKSQLVRTTRSRDM